MVLLFLVSLLAGAQGVCQPDVKGDAPGVVQLQAPGFPSGPLLLLQKSTRPLDASHIRKVAVLVSATALHLNWYVIGAVPLIEGACHNTWRSLPISARPPPFAS